MKHGIHQILVDELGYIYDGEMLLSTVLPEVIDKVESKHLKDSLHKHLEETKKQITRLEEIFALLEVPAVRKSSEPFKALINECKKCLMAYTDPVLRDIAIIVKLQCIEHLEIAVYGTLLTFAKELGLDEIEDLLNISLGEEGRADKKLSKLAAGGLFTPSINKKAI